MTLPNRRVPQDLHLHTTFSRGDGAVAMEQTVALVASVRHASVLGVADHIEYVHGSDFAAYRDAVRAHGLYLGTEVTTFKLLPEALELDVDYYVFHCEDRPECYQGAEKLLGRGVPVIIAHPGALGTDLTRVPPECLIEINNRYIWRGDWRAQMTPFTRRFRFVVSSDAHQPHWLNQNVARYVAEQLGVQETILFEDNDRAEREGQPPGDLGI